MNASGQLPPFRKLPFLFTLALAILGLATLVFISQSAPVGHLTIQQVTDLTAPVAKVPHRHYTISLDPFGVLVLDEGAPEGELKNVREFPYPTEFNPPTKIPFKGRAFAVTQFTPTAFEHSEAGWTIHLTATTVGQLVEVTGEAKYVEIEMVPGGYGEIAGRLYVDQGDASLPNKIEQPKIQTTTSRFHVFALPGKSYEVMLYHGDKRETHTLTVAADKLSMVNPN